MLLCLLAFWTASIDAASHKQKRVATTRGVRKKQWRRRNEDFQSAAENSRATIVTNPSTLGKGKGKGGNPNEYVYTSEDENGRTTFVVKCSEYAAAKRAAEQAGEKKIKTGEVKASEAKESGLTKTSAGDNKATSSSTLRNGPDEYCEEYLNGVSGEGGSGDGDEDESSNDNTGSYLPEDNTSGVAGGSGGLASCDAIAAGNGPQSGDSESVEVKLEVVKEKGLDNEGIMSLMQADLQFHVAPEIADCTTDGDSGGASSGGETLITNVVFEGLEEDSSGKCRR